MLPHRTAQAYWLIATLLLVTVLIQPPARSSSAADPETAVAGRLGGTLETFVERFGESTAFIPALGPLYGVDGYGLLVAYVEGFSDGNNVSELDPSRRLNRIIVSSPRPLDRSALEPDPTDWTMTEATEHVAFFLPTDAELSAFDQANEGQQSSSCESDALGEIFTVRVSMQCRVVLIMPTPETVSYVVMTLIPADQASDDQIDAVAPCAGVVEWIRGAGNQLSATQALIADVGAIDEADPTAAAALRDIGSAFRDLAVDQRASDPPEVTAQANFYLISALTTYADAIETAADGVEQHDETLIDEAVAAFEQAEHDVAQVNSEIAQAGDACALQLGTPVPTGSPIPSS